MSIMEAYMNSRERTSKFKCEDCCKYEEYCSSHSMASISERVYLIVREGRDCWEPAERGVNNGKVCGNCKRNIG